MKPLLIHNDNTYLLDIFQENKWYIEKFESTLKSDIDLQIDDFIDRRMAVKEISAVFVKVSLTKNYLELLGFRVGLHIRLSYRHPSLQKLPIVFLCEESLDEVCRICSYPEILFSDGIYMTSESIDCICVFLETISSGTLSGCSSLTALMDRLYILPPANYLSHHSIANEWSILRWAKILGVSEVHHSLKEIKENTESLLYYKYLQAKYPIVASDDTISLTIEGKGKVLYIDDEWIKGWNIIFDSIFSGYSDINFNFVKANFKEHTRSAIIEICVREISSFDPDVIVLDLRLCDADFDNITSTDLTGYKILQKIKGYVDEKGDFIEGVNPGIQVILFTASNKVWNLTELQSAGADNFIMKESPELSIDKDFSKSSLEKMATVINDALKMAFLKKVHSGIKYIQQNVNTSDKDFKFRLKNNLEISFRLLRDTKISAKYYNYAYLQLFQIIEDYCNLPTIFSEEIDSFTITSGKAVCVQKVLNNKVEQAIRLTTNGKYEIGNDFYQIQKGKNPKRLDTNFKVASVLIFRYGNSTSSVHKWTDVYSIRNSKAAHFNKEDMITEDNINTLFKFIKYFICTAAETDINAYKGLKEKSFNESVELLKNRFKHN